LFIVERISKYGGKRGRSGEECKLFFQNEKVFVTHKEKQGLF
jgi:hypothetical protein